MCTIVGSLFTKIRTTMYFNCLWGYVTTLVERQAKAPMGWENPWKVPTIAAMGWKERTVCASQTRLRV